jgi:aryl-alcohol dehydrogenase-like predicted oxidoreductase
MDIRTFGNTELRVSEIGFGAWGIGGPAKAGDTPIGWGEVDDSVSIRAIEEAVDQGITFFDTADVYGLGHSEALIGDALGNRADVVIASKVGHRVEDGSFIRDYDPGYIRRACEASLRRLRRDTIDYYQLHSAKVEELREGRCVEAMERLRDEGKIRYWGVSLNTFDPFTDGDFIVNNRIGDGLQVVLNIINQRAIPLIRRASAAGYGIVARMPLQFGLLTGKFTRESTFGADDHRSNRLTPSILRTTLDALEDLWPIKDRYGVSETGLSLSFAVHVPGVSTVIPGIKTPAQARANTAEIVRLREEDMVAMYRLYEASFSDLVDLMHDVERKA